jgi:hypothetical protein
MAQSRMVKLTLERLKELLDYDPATGVFVWKENRRRGFEGARAGKVDKRGYRYIRIDGEDHTAPRLAWLYVHGTWPTIVRFKDDNKDNCAIDNLVLSFTMPDGHDHKTREGRSVYQKAYRATIPHVTRDKQLQRDFGITLATYNKMMDDQGGVCAICEKPEFAVRSGKIRALAVDHDHETGAVRSLLCTNCNPMIGYAKDNPILLRKAAAYLERHKVAAPVKKETV